MAVPFLRRLFDARRTAEPRQPDETRVAWTRPLAGVAVTPDTAITVPAVWACIRYLSQTVAVPPWHVMRPLAQGAARAPAHPIDYLLCRRPCAEYSSAQFRETLTHWALRWGNGYAEIERDGLARPFALWPLHPERVEVKRDLETGALYYEVNNGTHGRVRLERADMFHIRGFGEGPVGVNVMQYAAESIGWARAVQLFGAAFFGNGMNIAGVVQTKQGLSDIGVKRLLAKLEALYKGPRRAHRWAVLDAGMEAKPLQIDPEKGQFIATNQHLVEEVCRWFGVPPHKISHLLRSTFNNIEHQSIEVVVDSVTPWVKRFEDEADDKLFGQNRQGFYTKMNLRALLRGDFKSQAEGFQIYRNLGVYNANEIRALLDDNPMPAGAGGDKYVIQGQYTTLERVGEAPAAPALSPREDDEDDETDEAEARARAMIEAMAADLELEHAA